MSKSRPPWSGRTPGACLPMVMGILNVTPDSFFDGGRWHGEGRALLDAAVRHAEAMQAEGAMIVDVGGESTRPGSHRPSLQEEMDRVLPVVERIAAELPVAISVDTSAPELMTEAIALGAVLVNDVRALTRPGALEAVAATPAGVCLMHMQGEPGHMQDDPQYTDVVADVRDFLLERVAACRAAGIGDERICLDPGFGFGKTLGHNLSLLASLAEFAALGFPVLAGLSRKSMLGRLLADRPVAGRLHASVAAAVLAAERGASIIRVHDVGPTVDALKIWAAVREAEEP